MSETLVGGYFALLGALSSEPEGLAMLSRWRMINMFYHIVNLKERDDLIRLLLGNMDFTLSVVSQADNVPADDPQAIVTCGSYCPKY